MKDFVAIPTWTITRLVLPFVPGNHPWYGKRFTLRDWASHQTPLCRMFDVMLWLWLPATAAGVIWLTAK